MARRILITLLLVSIVGTLPGYNSRVTAQQDQPLAPNIIDVSPPPGAELLPSDVLTLYFDQPMNFGAVEKAVSFSPALDGVFHWTDDQTLTFTPASPWNVGQTYEVTVGKDAAARSGAALDAPYQFKVRTLSALTAANVSPAPDASDVETTAKIVVSFNHPVIALGKTATLVPFTITPDALGKGEWVNTSLYVYTPAGPLATDSDYRVTVTPGLQSVDGASMDGAYSWTFHTLPPQVSTIDYQSLKVYADEYGNTELPDPKNVYPNTTFKITFSQSVERSSVEKALSLIRGSDDSHPISGSIAWNFDSTYLTFTPDKPLSRDTDYQLRLSLGKSAKSYDFKFHTLPLPAVIESDPKNETSTEVGYYFDVSVLFNTPLDPQSVEGHVIVNSHQLRAGGTVSRDESQRLLINFAEKANMTYAVTVTAGIKDIFGAATTSDYTFSFTVFDPPPPPPPPVSPIINGDMMIFPAYKGDVQIPVSVPAKQSVDLGLYRWLPTMLGDVPFSNHQIYQEDTSYYSGPWNGNGDTRCKPAPAVNRANVIRKWSQPFDPAAGGQQALLPAEKGSSLPLGLYWLTMGDEVSCVTNPRAISPADFISESGPQFQFGFAVATANITLKRGPEDVFVFLTDLQTAKPVANTTVTVYADGQSLGTAMTDATGAATIPVHMQDHRFILITAEAPGVFGAWYNNWYSEGWRTWGGKSDFDYGYDLSDPVDGKGYLYTDRPIYRPGDVVHFRGTLRKKRDMQYPVPDQKFAYVRIGPNYSPYAINNDSSEPWLFDGKVTLTDYGTFSGDFTIPKDSQLGTINFFASLTDFNAYKPDDYEAVYRQEAQDASITITVADYRAPEIEMTVKAAQPTIIQGDPLDATVQVGFYSGGAVKQTRVQWDTTYCQTSFVFKGSGNYSFDQNSWAGYGDYGYYSYYNDYSSSCYYDAGNLDSNMTAETDDKGRAAIHTTNTLPDGQQSPVEITVEGTSIDQSGIAVSNRTSVLAYPSNLFVGIGTDSYIGTVQKPITFNLITVSPDSQISPNQRVTLSVDSYNWKSTDQQTAWIAANKNMVVSTDTTGKATYRFSPQNTGVYRLTATVTDSQGHDNSASLSVWVTDAKTASWFTRSGDDPLVILTDRRDYKPGDTASLLIPVPTAQPTTVLLSVERAGVITHDVLYSNGTEPILYSLPITDDMAPDAFINATYIRGTDSPSDNDPDDRSNTPTFQVSDDARIVVESQKQQLTITLQASQGQLKPGDNATFDVWVKDADGKPAVADVGIKLVDKSVIDLLPDNSDTLFDTFFNRQPLETYTDVSIDGLLENVNTATSGPPGRGGGGGGGGGGGPAVRSDFQVTPLWSPDVITDANGHAAVSVKLPDNLTTFQLDARALTLGPDMKVGQATIDIISSLPLIIRPETPRFFVVGDQVDLAAIVNNNTDQDQQVTVQVQASGITLDSAASQQVTVLSGTQYRITWRGTVQDAPDADLVFSAVGQNGAQDAAKPSLTTGPNGTIPIYRFTTTENLGATSGVLRTAGSKTEGLTLPPRLKAEQGSVTVRIDPSLASTINNSFTYLRQYPYFCIEQTVSRFLPNVATYHALSGLYKNNPTLEANLKAQLKSATDKLVSEQKADGSWGWYPDTPTDPLTSAYAALGLSEAKNAGFSVDGTMLSKAVAYVQSQISSPLGLEPWQINRQAFYLYVLARNGIGTQDDFEALYATRQHLSLASRAYLLMAFHERFPSHDAVKTLTNDLLSAAQFSATGTHWEESETDWYNWGSDTRTTALILTALLRTDPQSDLLPDVIRWLMAARQDDHWPTTQETAWSITALSEWMVTTGELNSSYRFDVRLNNNPTANGTISPANLSSQSINVAVKDILTGTANHLTVSRGDGTGALYYTAQFSAQVNAADVKAASQGITVKREYFADVLKSPVTSANLGDVITARLTITTNQTLHYFTLDDMFPAGLEAVDTSLLTTSNKVAGPTIEGISTYDPYWYWGWWYFDHIELRDAETNINATYLPAGTYIYTYQLRATTTGVFQVIPAHAYTFYSSDVWGRSDGSVFTVNAPNN